MKASMGEERLSVLAMTDTQYDMVIDMEEAVDLFARLHIRKLELKTCFSSRLVTLKYMDFGVGNSLYRS